jgi:DNA topoisomerase-1
MKLQGISLVKNDAEFYDQFHPNVKDVEANAERESGENLGDRS